VAKKPILKKVDYKVVWNSKMVNKELFSI